MSSIILNYKTDFIAFFQQKLDERLHLRMIEQSTYDVQTLAFRRIKEYVGNDSPTLPFHAFDRTWAVKFDAWLKTAHGNGINTRWARHKDTTTYIHLAELDNIQFVNPYLYSQEKEHGRQLETH